MHENFGEKEFKSCQYWCVGSLLGTCQKSLQSLTNAGGRFRQHNFKTEYPEPGLASGRNMFIPNVIICEHQKKTQQTVPREFSRCSQSTNAGGRSRAAQP